MSFSYLPFLGVTLPRISPACGWIREQPSGRQILQVPFRCALSPPCPEDPPRMRLVGIKLGVNEVLKIVLVIRAQIGNRSCRFAITRTDVAGSRIGESTIIACSFPETIEPFSAVGLCTCPFTDDGPLVGSGELRAESAGSRDVVRGAHGDLRWREDLVLMSIENHILVAR